MKLPLSATQTEQTSRADSDESAKEPTMNTSGNWMRIIAGMLVSGGIAAAGWGLGAFALGDGPTYWCPGQNMPASNPPLTWDMNVCHQYHRLTDQQYAEGPLPGNR
ncbi:hypothetical protein ATCCBAA256_06860 [Mycobacterium montefiorense]|nr:hypothetical protein ATCCBAA256_06860 [Mycobacterium montefiorense]